jgi:Ca2+-dependent lipid-binding protein
LVLELQFNQTFKFKCNDYRGKIITVTGFDFDVGSKNDLIGTATIELSDLLDAEADYNSYILLDKDKQPIKGYDKQVRFHLRFGIAFHSYL